MGPNLCDLCITLNRAREHEPPSRTRDRDPRLLLIGGRASQTQTPANGLAPTPSSETWAFGALKLEHGWNTSLERLWSSADFYGLGGLGTTLAFAGKLRKFARLTPLTRK
jgi:hypothetical protein